MNKEDHEIRQGQEREDYLDTKEEQIKTPSVLIACPITSKTSTSIQHWINWVGHQNYPYYDFMFSVNGKGQEMFMNKLRQIEIHNKEIQDYPCKKPIVKRIPIKYEDTIEKITESRKQIVNHAIDHRHDFILFLDADVIPTHLSALNRLLSHDLPVVAGLYPFASSQQFVAGEDAKTGIPYTVKDVEPYGHKAELFKAGWAGFGFMLIRRDVFSNIPIAYNGRNDFGEDIQFCNDLSKQGISLMIDPMVIGRHMKDSYI